MGALLIVVGIVLTATLAGAAFFVRGLRIELDPNTNCPLIGPSAVHVILVDRSDPISPQQAQHVKQWANLLRSSADAGTRFDIYTFDGDSERELHPVLSVCAVQRDANPLYQNPKMIRDRYEDQFATVLDQTVADLLRAGTLPSSPIIESLRAAAQTSFGLIANKETRLRVTLISDLVQHSVLTSHLRSEADFKQLTSDANWPRLRPNLRGAEVEFLYLLRPTALRKTMVVQNRGHQEFWTFLIAASGGRVTEFTPF